MHATAPATNLEPAEIEADLIRQTRAGSRNGFESLYRLHSGRVFGLCLRLARHRETAEELTQEVFVRAWQKRDGFRPELGIGAWLRRVAVNLHVSGLRTRTRRGDPVSLPADDLLGADALPAPSAGVDLERAVAGLSDSTRTVYVLHDIAGYKHREIADMTGIAIGTSKAHLHRARAQLKRMLQS